MPTVFFASSVTVIYWEAVIIPLPNARLTTHNYSTAKAVVCCNDYRLYWSKKPHYKKMKGNNIHRKKFFITTPITHTQCNVMRLCEVVTKHSGECRKPVTKVKEK